jgi:tRNA-2-methylthio-N6-dimethylallyladenosine synthase
LKKVFIETLGCAMNVRDTEHIIAELQSKENYTPTLNHKEADLIIINTCSVRDKPVQKLFSELGAYNKKKKLGAKIGVTGCSASHLGKEIIKRAPYVDFVLGARNISKITKVLHKKGSVEINIDYDESAFNFADYRGSKYKAYINISIGCDKACTFCIVPKTRGDEISVPAGLIINEVKKAVNNGIKEVFLLGQNVNNYGRRFSSEEKKINFTDLLKEVSKIEALERIRFTSPHPLHMDDEFLEEFASNPKIAKSMHMPLQSGSTSLLKSMKRGYTKEWFLNRVNKLKQMVPDVSISTDIIVGFPGESDKDFEDTMDILNQVQFEQVFSFKYSPRPHTEAEHFADQISVKIASSRLTRLQERQNEILDILAQKRLGQKHFVLLDEQRDDRYFVGRSDNNLLIKVQGDMLDLGKIIEVEITEANRQTNKGKRLE